MTNYKPMKKFLLFTAIVFATGFAIQSKADTIQENYSMGSMIEAESDTKMTTSSSQSSSRLRAAAPAAAYTGWSTDSSGNTTYYLNGVLKPTGTIASPNDDGYTYAYSDATKKTVIAKRLDHPGDITKSINNLATDAVDIASYQYWMTQADFNALKTQGVKTIVIKLTQSTNYTNPYAASHIKMAQNAGLNIATYHFAIFGSTSNQTTATNAAIVEAKYYAAQAKALGISSNTVMIEDAEYSGTASSVWTNASVAFRNQLVASGYPQVKYYTSKSWATSGTMNTSTLGIKNFWVAQYLYGTPKTNATGWNNTYNNNSAYGALQYTSQMYYNNQSSVNPVDTSVDYSDFFGSSFTSLTEPRFMKINVSKTYRYDLNTIATVGSALTQNQVIKFVDKKQVNGVWYLRTQADVDSENAYGVPQSALTEITTSTITPKYMYFTSTGWKSDPATQSKVGNNIGQLTLVKVFDTYSVNGKTYYRTEEDAKANNRLGISGQFLADVYVISLDGPRMFYTTEATVKTNFLTNSTTAVKSGDTFFITKKVLINDVWYFQTKTDEGSYTFINSSKLSSTVKYINFLGPRKMKLIEDNDRVNPLTGEVLDRLHKDKIIDFSTKVYINGEWYYRTAFNTANNTNAAIPAKYLTEVK